MLTGYSIARRLARLALLGGLLSGIVLAQDWTQQNPSPSPTARQGTAIAYDTVHHQTVVFGGMNSSGTLLNETWVYDGTKWTNVTPASGNPSPRVFPSMAFDADTGTAVMFGGCTAYTSPNCTAYNSETWLWNGSAWNMVTPSGSVPTARYGAAIAYQPTGLDGILLFGGQDSTGPRADTWVFVSGAWSPQETPPVPARVFASMSYDSINGIDVMFGGQGTSSNLNDTWLWNGLNWNQATNTNPPSVRAKQGQVYDPVRQVTVMFGGGSADTWLFNGQTQKWSQETTAHSPDALTYVNVAYDVQHADVVLFGGFDNAANAASADTWTLGYQSNFSWSQLNPTFSSIDSPIGGPGNRSNMAYGTDGQTIYAFGGTDGMNNVYSDTWEWPGTQWGNFVSSNIPPARQSAAMAWSQTDASLVMFGGNSSAAPSTLNPLNDTWLFNGSSGWNPKTTSTQPGARAGQGMASDAVHKAVVLFGGYTAGFVVNSETWLWQNDAWTKQSPLNSPQARAYPQMVYDGARQQTLLFGGLDNHGNPLSDTWVWDGANWTELFPTTTPSARSSGNLMYDSTHGLVVLFGGFSAQAGFAGDTWQWDGVNWTEINSSTGNPFGEGSVGVYLPSAQQFLIYGGFDCTTCAQSDTWVLTSPFPATAELPTAFTGQTYSTTIQPSSGVGPYTFTQVGTPSNFSGAGLSLNSSTGAITGTDTLTSGAALGVGVNIKDAQGQSTIITFEVISDNPITFNVSSLEDATVSANYFLPLTASGGTPPFTYNGFNLPAGLSVAGGEIQGQCQATGSYSNIFFTATDSLNGQVTVGPLTLKCNPYPVITNPSSLPNGQLNQNYSVQLTTNAVYDPPGAPTYTWYLQSGSGLPPGLNIDAHSGVISGMPTANGTTTFTMLFTDGWGATASETFTIVVGHPITVTATQLAIGNQGIAYPAGQGIGATGGMGTLTYTVTAATFPPGLTLNQSTGAITGTPTTVGTYNAAFTVSDTSTDTTQTTIPIYVVTAGSDSEDWVQLAPTTPQGYVANQSMFYDSTLTQTILFGGTGTSGVLSNTYSWNGTNWGQLSGTGPSARYDAAVAYDPVHKQGVMFGGVVNGSVVSETWLWNNNTQTWTQASPANPLPLPRADAMMAWDGQHIVLFGGSPFEEADDFNDTWIWDGTNWTQVTIANPPEERDSGGMAYDSVHNQVVLFGGTNPGIEGDFQDTWVWNGTNQTWTNLNIPVANSAPGRDGMSLVFDPVRQQVVMFGGLDQTSFNYHADTWAFNGTSWSQINTPHAPAPRNNYGMVNDTLRSATLLFGGSIPSSPFGEGNDTWVLGGPYVGTTTLPGGTVNAPYSQAITIVGGITPYTLVNGTLPPGMSFNTSNGTFGGTPTQVGNYTIPVTIQDAQGIAIVPQFSIAVSPPVTPLQLSPTTLPDATAGANYLVQLSATGGSPPYVFSDSGLPNGLNINSGNQIVGQCTASSSNVMYQVTDSALNVVSVGPLTVTCNPAPSITTTSLPTGTVGTSYSAQIQMTGGTAPITWSISSGSLPTGYGLSNTGVISGPGTAPVSASFTVQTSDLWHAIATQAYTLTVSSVLTITTTSLPTGTQGSNYPSGVTIAATGGSGAYTFSAVGLPNGLQIDQNTGAITGIPTVSGSFDPTFQVIDQTPQTVTRKIGLSILATTGNPNWTNLNPPNSPGSRDSYAEVYDPLHQVTVLFGGTGMTDLWEFTFPSTWTSVTPNGTVPSGGQGAGMAWMNSQNNIVLFGGNNSADVAQGQTWTWNGTLWTPQSPSHVPPARAFPGMAPDSAHNTVVMFGGTIDSDASQAINDTWVWNGTDWAPQSTISMPALYAPSLADGPTGPVLFGGQTTSGQPTNQTYVWNGSNWTLQSPLVSPPARSLAGMAYNSQKGVTTLFGGRGSSGDLQDTWQWDGSDWTQLNPQNLPAARDSFALAFDSNFNQLIMFGGVQTPTNGGDTWALGGPAITVTTLLAASAGVSYNANIGIVGGTPPYGATQTGTPQSLPSGLTLVPGTGQINGATESVGTYSVGINVLDSQAVSNTSKVSLAVSPASALVLAPTILPDATAGANYSVQLSATGGVPGYVFSVTGLPAGLSINSGNQIVGSCTAGSTNVMLSVTDSASPVANMTSVGPLTVHCNPAPAITTTSLPTGTVGMSYSAQVQMTGGTAPIVWSISSGSLPTGYSLSNTGVISGPASAPVSASFTVQAADLWNAIATHAYTLTISSVLTITTTSLPTGTQGSNYSSAAIAVTGGSGAGTYTFSATGLPTGLQIDQNTGAITGIPTVAGNFTPTFQVIDQTPQTVTRQIALSILSITGNPNWTNLNPSNPPGPRESYAAVYDPVRQVTVLVGGTGEFGDPWEFTFPSTWNLVIPNGTVPAGTQGPGMAWMNSQSNIVLFGGNNGTDVAQNQTWTWDGTVWTQQSPAHVPGYRAYPGMAPDSAHNTVVMFGGSNGNAAAGALNDTWVWNGTDWTSQSTISMPALYAPSLADGPTGPVLFGGQNSSGQATNQTYVWNGSNWVLQSPLVSPPARALAGMVYNSQNGVTILFGGRGSSGLLQDTWQWDGSQWTQLNPQSVPAARSSISLAYDSVFNQIIMAAGQEFPNDANDTWTLGGPAITVTNLPAASAGVAYNGNIGIVGGTPPYVATQTGLPQSLPSGLMLGSGSGQISGATESVGTYSVGINVLDSQAVSTTSKVSISVSPVTALMLSPTSLPDATVGANYSVQLSAVGGVPAYLFSATGLPAGLSINSSNQLVGMCTAGSTTVMLGVTDSASPVANTASVGPLTVHCNAAPTITTTTLASGVVNTPYSATIQMTGGTAPINWVLTPGTLPTGFSISSSGVLTGTVTAPTTASFSVTVTDLWGATNKQNFTLSFYVSLGIGTASLPNDSAGVPYSQTLSGTGGSGNYSWTATGLPSWLTLTTAGVLSGTPTAAQAGPYSFQITLKDTTVGNTVTQPYSLTVFSGLGINTSSLPTATVSTLYSQTLTALGGSGNYSWTATGLPSWLTLTTAGVLSGTPPQAGPVNFQVTLKDTTVGNSITQPFTLNVYVSLGIGTASLPNDSVGVPYSQTLSGTGGSGNYSWTATGLPSWLTLTTAGVLSGTPTAAQAGPYSFQVTLKDTTVGNTVNQPYSLTVFNGLGINPSSLPTATVSTLYSQTLTALGGSGNYSFSATGLPTWLSLSTAGVLSGTPPQAAQVNIQVTLKDTTIGNSITVPFTLNVYVSLGIGTASLPNDTVGVPYSQTLSGSGGSGNYSWTATGLPSWLTLTTAGVLSGTPTAAQAGPYSFQVTLKDTTVGNTVSQSYSLTVFNVLGIQTTSLPIATVNTPYSTTLAAVGGSGGYGWTGAGLPSGLSISKAGLLGGSISQAGPYTFSITVTDSQNLTLTKSFTLLVSTGLPLSFSTQGLNSCTVGVSCSNQISASGGIPPYTFSLGPNASLSGLSLSANGAISGAPTSAGTISIPVVLTDQQTSISRTFTVTVISNLTILTSSLSNGTVGSSYGQVVQATGGQPPYTFSLASGTLPPGLSLDPQGGNIYGTPTTAGTFPFSIQVSDGLQTSQPHAFSVSIAPPPISLSITSASLLPPGTTGVAYSVNLAAAGGSGSYTWSLATGAPPAGLSISPSGAITGTPTAAGTATFTATVRDTNGNTVSAGFSIVVSNPNSVSLLTSSPLPNGAIGVPYNYGIQVSGGTPPYFWSITQGQVPPGLTFDATNGTLNGTPLQSGPFNIVLTVEDSTGTAAANPTGSLVLRAASRLSVTNSYTIQIAGTGDFQITTPESLPLATLGQPYSLTFTTSGGSAPYQWQLSSGTLPTGLALTPAGQITGSPTVAGTYSLVVRVADSNASATGAFLLIVASANTPVISPIPPPPPGTVGVAYQGGFTAAGGHPPYTWSIGAGSLPTGLNINPQSGALSGTPSQAGAFPFTVQVTDNARVAATQAFTIRVNAMDLQISPSAIPAGTANVPYSFEPSVTGGTAPYTWSLSAGGLLGGFSIDPSSGLITGTPTASGNFQFTISVVDVNYGLAMQTYQFNVQTAGISIVTTTPPAAVVGSLYTYSLMAANASPPLTWTVASGTLPPGIQLNSAVAQLTGTPTKAGAYNFTIQVNDASTASAQASLSLVVNPPPLTIATTSLPSGAVASAYSQALQSNGGAAPITWSVSSGTLPAGLSLTAATGLISGTPTAVGTSSFTIAATDANGVSAHQNLTLTIAGPPAAPTVTLSGLPGTSHPGDQPTVTITLSNAYPLPIVVTATLSISPNSGNTSDLMFSNGSRTIQITIPANATQATLPFQVGTLAGTIQVSLSLSAAGVNITPTVAPATSTTIAAAAPVISSVGVATTSTGLTVTVIGTSTTLDMKTATFQFTPASGATLQTTTITMDVSAMFAAWYANSASFATGSQFAFSVPFTVGGNVSTIQSVSVTLTNSVGTSAAASAIVP